MKRGENGREKKIKLEKGNIITTFNCIIHYRNLFYVIYGLLLIFLRVIIIYEVHSQLWHSNSSEL